MNGDGLMDAFLDEFFQKFFNDELESVDHLFCTYFNLTMMPSLDWPLQYERPDGFEVICLR